MKYQENQYSQAFNKASARAMPMGRKMVNTRSIKGNMNMAFKSYAQEILARKQDKSVENTIKIMRDLPANKR